MALTQSGIGAATETLRRIMGQENALTDLNEVTDFMTNDENFQRFARGTNAGVTIEYKWRELAKLIHGDLYQSLANLDRATAEYLCIQQEINNQKTN